MTSILTRHLAVSVLRNITKNPRSSSLTWKALNYKSNLKCSFNPMAGYTNHVSCQHSTMETKVTCRCGDCKNTGKGHCRTTQVSDIEQAFSLPETEFKMAFHIEKPSTRKDNIVLYCKSGKRATDACEMLHRLGYTRVKRYPGSMTEWEETLLGSTAASRRKSINLPSE